MSDHIRNKRGQKSSSPEESQKRSWFKRVFEFFKPNKKTWPIVNFLIAFAIGTVVIIAFFVLSKRFYFFRHEELDFWVKAVLALVIATLILRVGNKVSPEETPVSRAVPTVVIFFFIGILIWHYGVVKTPDNRGNSGIFNGIFDKKEETPKASFNLSYNEESRWIQIPPFSEYSILSNQGDYQLEYFDGSVYRFYSNGEGDIPFKDNAKFKIKSLYQEGEQIFEVYWHRI